MIIVLLFLPLGYVGEMRSPPPKLTEEAIKVLLQPPQRYVADITHEIDEVLTESISPFFPLEPKIIIGKIPEFRRTDYARGPPFLFNLFILNQLSSDGIRGTT